MTTANRRTGGAVLIVAMLLTGCAGSGRPLTTESQQTTTTTPAPTTATTTAPAQNLEADKVLAKAQLVTLPAFPEGWTEAGPATTGTSADSGSSSLFTTTQIDELATCLHNPPALSITAAEASSPSFFSPDSYLVVDDTADVYASAADAKTDFPPVASAAFATCFGKVHGPMIVDHVKSSYMNGPDASQFKAAVFGAATASAGAFPLYGDESGMVVVKVPITFADKSTSTEIISFVFIRQGRSIAQLILDSENTAFPASIATTLATTVTAKMKATPATGN